MKISDKGIRFIQKEEGGCSLKVYLDQVGLPTVGWGHMDKNMKLGDKYTLAQVEALFKDDLGSFESCLNAAVKVPLHQYEFDALMSLTFNIGTGAILRSQLLKKLNDPEYTRQAVMNEFLKWNKGTIKGKLVELPVLVGRRKREAKLFETGYYGSVA